jgi:DNA-binding HxlR family transcriptional regulator
MEKKSSADPFKNQCPSREILELVGGKWSLLLICQLQSGPARTGELMRSLDGVSQKMLTQTLRELETYGIILRTSYPEVPPRVEYHLTPLGKSLAVVVRNLENWVVSN